LPLAVFFTLLSALSLIGVCGLARLRANPVVSHAAKEVYS
jgi:hypothetical protein